MRDLPKSAPSKAGDGVSWGHPSATPTLFGHGLLERRVLRLIAAGRMPAALLLAGERGVGKATFAYRIARMLLSGKRPRDLKNGVLEWDDATAQHIANRTHPDIWVVDASLAAAAGEEGGAKPTRAIDVGMIRDVTAFLRKKPRLSAWRIVVIEGVEDMTLQGANALLKTLEEPPLNALLILIAHKEGRLPLTIRSRCHRLYFGALSRDEMAPALATHLSQLRSSELTRLMELGGGRLGAILSLESHGALAFSDALCQLMETTLKTPAFDWTTALLSLVPAAPAEPTWALFWELYLWWLSRLMQLDETPLEDVFKSPEHQTFAREMLTYHTAEEWCMLYHQVAHIFKQTHLLQLDPRGALLSAFRVLQNLQPIHQFSGVYT